MWNTLIVNYVFNHRSVNDLLRELYVAPSEASYSRFLVNLLKCKEEMKEVFEGLVDSMYENLEGFGEELAGDGKAIQSYARTNGKGKDIKFYINSKRFKKSGKENTKKEQV